MAHDLVAHDCGYPLLRYTRVALHVSQLISWILQRFAGVAPVSRYTPKNFGVATPPPPVPGGVAPKFGSEKVSRYTGVSQLQLQVSLYTVQLSEIQAYHKERNQDAKMAFYLH